ncbi:MAG TPA: hypothetical protein VMH81_07075, partial [Bryobacteraceae bacterium]|nr:hypothetical protein [Bryobacteraceae bacterium]
MKTHSTLSLRFYAHATCCRFFFKSLLALAGLLTSTLWAESPVDRHFVSVITPQHSGGPSAQAIAELRWYQATTVNKFHTGLSPTGVCFDGYAIYVANLG